LYIAATLNDPKQQNTVVSYTFTIIRLYL